MDAKKIIYLKYDELYLKGNNINFFKDVLLKNLTKALTGFKYKIKQAHDLIILDELEPTKIDLMIYIIARIPGFSYCALAYEIARDLTLLYELILNLLTNYQTFKVEPKRIDKKYEYNSDQLKRMIASYVLNHNNSIKVDIHEPEAKVFVEVKKDKFIVYLNKIACTKGLPVGSSGKALMLLSGGIDSPVASHQLLTRGMHVDFLVFYTPPYTKEELIDKIKRLVKIITLNYRLESPKIYLCNYTKVQTELTHTSFESYRITLLRRSFLRIANELAKRMKYDCLATGDALGQVASQTIESMRVIDDASKMLVLRPLISYNKEAIINYAKKINTYGESIVPLSDTCSLFAPKKPVTKPKLDVVLKLESDLSLLKDLEHHLIDDIKVVKYDKK